MIHFPESKITHFVKLALEWPSVLGRFGGGAAQRGFHQEPRNAVRVQLPKLTRARLEKSQSMSRLKHVAELVRQQRLRRPAGFAALPAFRKIPIALVSIE